MLYPAVSDHINRMRTSQAIQSFADREISNEEELRQLQLARAYNASLLTGLEPEIPYEQILDYGDGVMGYIEIPTIKVKLPIYHGMSSEVLAKGVGHMPGTAFPVSGDGNHTVLTGHTGLPSAQLFTDLTELKIGDRFLVTLGSCTVTYQVDQIKTVLPSDGSDLVPVPGEDYCTLLTCTPYGINSHRLLVRGRRVDPEGE